MCDSLEMMKPFLEKKSAKDYYFTTLHRPYNTDEDERLVGILHVLNELDKPVIFPIHPRTSNLLKSRGEDLGVFSNIEFIPPVGYKDCLSYQAHAACVITDSGGIQKEAYMLEKQCITIRKETEWVETLKGGCNTLVFEHPEKIKDILGEKRKLHFEKLYGDGHAAEEIASIIEKYLGEG
jgi:UDP-GlcNAc3NAcA epimerase